MFKKVKEKFKEIKLDKPFRTGRSSEAREEKNQYREGVEKKFNRQDEQLEAQKTLINSQSNQITELTRTTVDQKTIIDNQGAQIRELTEASTSRDNKIKSQAARIETLMQENSWSCKRWCGITMGWGLSLGTMIVALTSIDDDQAKQAVAGIAAASFATLLLKDSYSIYKHCKAMSGRQIPDGGTSLHEVKVDNTDDIGEGKEQDNPMQRSPSLGIS